MRICSEPFIATPEEEEFFSKYWEFQLSLFQKWAIRALLNKKHALITAHTGSGKTVPAEAAIAYCNSIGKKVIYTSPIKALTNQKYNEFSKKYPDISFGIFTGDNKHNPEADVLLMTAEILRNTLFQKKMIEEGDEKQTGLLSFDIDIKNDVGCIIMDEAHYINDKDRGAVWEETIILVDPEIPLLLLSATISKPDVLATLIENRGGPEVYICSTNKRSVPLTHYGYITLPDSHIKHMSYDARQKYLTTVNTPILLRPSDEEGGKFKDQNYEKMKKMMTYIKKNNVNVNRFFAINQIIQYVKNNELLPAIMFVFSRKLVNIIAEKIQIPLLDEESKIPSIIDKECTKLLKGKIANWKDYINLPEYAFLIKLLKKGIAIHHAGILKEFREMVELLFDKGYIKLLIATETFAVGINMPTKTTIFTALEKYDGSKFRYLEPSEYTQMAGRAGRRGIDTKGVVIHANNLFKGDIETKDYKHVLTGPPKAITSKFNIHLNLLLHLLASCPNNYEDFITRSLIKRDLDVYKKEVNDNLSNIMKYIDDVEHYNTDESILNELRQIEHDIEFSKPNQKRKLLNKYKTIMDSDASVKGDYDNFITFKKHKSHETKLNVELERLENWIHESCATLIQILEENEFIIKDESVYKLTNRGYYSTCLQEVFSLPFAEAIDYGVFENVPAHTIVSTLSCFTNIRVSDDNTVYSINHIKDVYGITNNLNNCYNKYLDIHNNNKLELVETNEYHLNLAEIMLKWCDAITEIECREILRECMKYEIGLGDFVKAVLKINNIAKELEKVALIKEDLSFLEELKKIPELTLKFCVSNQSLYL